MKKLGIVFAALIALLLAAIVIIPLVVDVDKYRPEIVSAANERINGKLELGALKLSLWGQIRIEVAGLTLRDAAGHSVVSVKDAYFHLPFSSLLSGSPSLNFHMENPVLLVVKDRAGKLNVMNLMKSSATTSPSNPQSTPQASPSGTPAAAPAQPSGSGNLAVPGMVAQARLGVELLHAQMTYQDEKTELTSQFKDLNLVMKNLSLSHETEIRFWSNLDTKLGKTFAVKGPIRLDGKAQPTLANGQFDHVSVSAKLDLDQLEMTAPDLFEKKAGVAANADLALTASAQEARIEHLVAKFFNAELKAESTITHLTAPAGGVANPVVRFSLKSNTIDLKPWNELIPLLKAYELGGAAELQADANGPSDKLSYSAKVKVDGLTAKSPMLKTQPRIDALVSVVTDQMDLTASIKAPANDLEIRGKVNSFTAPRADFQVTSSGMDLDQLVNFPPPAAKTKAAAPAGENKSGGENAAPAGTSPAAPVADYDAKVAPLRENKMLANTVANIGVNFKLLKAYNVKMTDVTGKLFFKDLTAGLDSFSMRLWDGTVRSSFSTAFKPAKPTYHFTSGVAGLDLAQAVESQLALFKNTVVGKATFDASGDGESFNTPAALGNLRMKGAMKVQNAVFATIDVGKMVTEALNKSLGQIASKVPGAAGKKINGLPGRESRYDLIASSFTTAGGKFMAPDFVAKAAPNQGIDLKGNTTVGMTDYSIKANWQVVDTYNLTHAKDISVDQAGVHVDHILAEGNGPVSFPVSVGCTLTAPCYSYTQVPEYLTQVAINNVTRAATGRAKSEVQKRVQDAVTQHAPPALQDKLKGFGKHLFGN